MLGIESSISIETSNECELLSPSNPRDNMRSLVLSILLALLGVVQAISSTGNRLLVVLEDESQKASFSKFWSDLEGPRPPFKASECNVGY
jgi:hypothetical protein